METGQSVSQINACMLGVMQDLQAIGKDSKNVQQNYAYRGIDDIFNQLHGLLSKHGIYCAIETDLVKREERPNKRGDGLIFSSLVRVEMKFIASDGSFVTSASVGEGMDSGDKATNKAISAAVKYIIINTFVIPTKDMDDSDKDSPDPSAPAVEKIAKEFEGTVSPYVSLADAIDAITLCQTLADTDAIKEKLAVGPWTEKEKATISSFFTQKRQYLKGGK